MKRLILILFLFMFGAGAAGTTQASNVSFSFSFHDALSPYGSWVNVSSYGECWRPRVYSGWRPYTQGHWIYTDHGPMFDSSEPYGWAVYHYGRWVYVSGYEWCWVPSYDWYPSRVTWAYGDDYLGWNPIYPSPGYNVNSWIFIDRNHFGYNDYSRVYFRGDRVRPLFERRVVRIQNRRLNRGDFERIVRRPVQVVSVRERTLEADRHRVRMIVPQHREATAIKEISRASKQRASARDSQRPQKTVVVKQSNKNTVVTNKHLSNKNLSAKDRAKSQKPPIVTHKSTVKQASQKAIVKKPPEKATIKKSTSPKSQATSSRFSSNKNLKTKESAKPTTQKTRSVTHKSPVKQISPKTSLKKTPQKVTVKKAAPKITRPSPKSPVVTSKYSSTKKPEMKNSSQQVKPVSRKQVQKTTAKKAPVKQNKKKPNKH